MSRRLCFRRCRALGKTVWKKGDVVEVERQNKWYQAEIIQAADNSYKVHYAVYDDGFDESVTPSHLRSPKKPSANDQIKKTESPVKDWTWKDGAGSIRTQTEFQDILQKHSEWLASGGQRGTRADLTNADLEAADLKAANLNEAQMSGVNLSKADLNPVFLKNANLRGATFN